jgi:hypothetical protein
VRRVALGVAVALALASLLTFFAGVHIAMRSMLDDTQWRSERAMTNHGNPTNEPSYCAGCRSSSRLGGGLIRLGLSLAGGAVVTAISLVVTRRRGVVRKGNAVADDLRSN